MIAISRVSPFQPQSGIPPFFGKDKLSMVLACQQSFLAAGDCTRIYLLDRCPAEWSKYFEKFGTVYQGTWGKKESLYAAYEVGRLHQDNLLFLEDDYLWRPDTLRDLDLAVRHFGLVSPYNHPDYLLPDEKNVVEAYVFNNQIWRWCPTNTHTFAVRHDVFSEHIDAFYYGLHDWQMYFKLRMEGVKLYTPMRSMATHLVRGKLAYDVNWEELAETYNEKKEVSVV